jgi:very-short-patch-repair endonuclease
MSELKENMHGGATKGKFAFAAYLRKVMTVEEKKMWEYLKNRPLDCKFRRQHAFKDYVLDFYCHSLKLSIEIDGGVHKGQKEYDVDRTAVIKESGIYEIRFTNSEVNSSFEKVIKKLETHLVSLKD